MAIACKRFPGTHSHTAIADVLVEIHASFGLNNNNIIATVTDNGSNFVKAFKVFGIDVDDVFLSGMLFMVKYGVYGEKAELVHFLLNSVISHDYEVN